MRVVPVVLLCLAAAAEARYEVAPWHPWTYSVTGAESANALAFDQQNRIWIAGNTWHPATGRDVLLVAWSATQTAVPVSGTITAEPLTATEYDRDHLDEGAPGLTVRAWHPNATQPENVPEPFLVFSTTAPGSSRDLTLWRLRGIPPVSTSPFHEDLRGGDEAGVAVVRTGSGTPFACGFTTVDGVDRLFAIRWIPRSGLDWAGGNAWTRASATDWTGSLTLSLTGRATAIDPDGAAWVIAQSGGDVVLARYTPGYVEDGGVNELTLIPAPGFPRRWSTASWDEPWAAVRDVTGEVWIAGESGGQAAIWRITTAGDLAPGFPVLLGPGSLFALVMDASRRCFATGRRGNELLLAAVDANGVPVTGLPLTAGQAPDSVEGRGIGVTAEGSVWVAATRTAAPATWGGTLLLVYRFAFIADPLPVAPGELKIRGPGGEILNLHRGEVLTIEALPVQSGELTIELLTLRGEAIRRFVVPSSGHRLVTVHWDGTNDAGHPVASGTYAVRVTGGGYRTIKRVVVIRRP